MAPGMTVAQPVRKLMIKLNVHLSVMTRTNPGRRVPLPMRWPEDLGALPGLLKAFGFCFVFFLFLFFWFFFLDDKCTLNQGWVGGLDG